MITALEIKPINKKAFIAELKQENRDLDFVIGTLEKTISKNHIEVLRLKKKKLIIKEKISLLENDVTPDIIA